jgi:glycine cleavage system H protein
MTRYTKEHEWIRLDGATATVGITEHAAHELGDITFVELPAVGAAFSAGDVLLVIESVKAAADVYMPVTGTVAAVNETLEDKPELINESPEQDGWLCQLSGVNAADLESLMTHDQYVALVKK